MHGELIQAVTSDGARLSGLWTPAAKSAGRAILHVHDWYSNFYDPPYLAALGGAAGERGLGLLSANTRGHDEVARLVVDGGNVTRGGAAYEHFDAARIDLTAWLDRLVERDVAEVVLVGHGFGASKVADYAARVHDGRVIGVVLAGPPDVGWLTRRLGERLDEALAWALLMLEAGQADELVRIDGLGYLAAGAIRELFGARGALRLFDFADPRHDWNWLRGVGTPMLALYAEGANTSQPPTECLEILQAAAATALTTMVIAGGTATFAGVETQFAETVAAWAASLTPDEKRTLALRKATARTTPKSPRGRRPAS
jgi:hypothetical protein